MKVSYAWLLVLLVVSIAILPQSVNAKSSEQKAIEKSLGKVGYKNICKLGVTIKTTPNDNAKIIYDNPKCHVVVPPTCGPNEHLENNICVPNSPQPPVCNIKEHLENGVCVPDVPNPPPPTTDNTKVCLVGDLSGSTVPNMMNKVNSTSMRKYCNLKIALGDCGYQSTFAYCKALNFDRCLIGNHETTEDAPKSDSPIIKEALAYCGDHWSLKIANNQVLVIGLNTNGDIKTQTDFAASVISQNSLVKSVIIVSHKNGHVFPNSHHPAEAASLYSQIESMIPTGVKLIEVSGHNHDNAAAPAKNWYVAGAGGKSFYSCGTDADWTFCDNTHVGYLELTIDNNSGATATKFIK